MNRIKEKFDELRKKGKKALIPYITPEFPVQGVTLPLLRELDSAGADLIEIGVPFSDPLADGKTIQRSSDIALRHGVTISKILQVVREFRKESETPLLLMGYINPIMRYGISKFLGDCGACGIDGLIIPDLPPEEASEIRQASSQRDISNVFLIAPTTPDQRIRQLDELSTDFSYCVSVTGVTGARVEIGSDGSFDHFLKRVRKNTKKPFVVGFGISKPNHVKHVWQFADGAVVGSALLQAIEQEQSIESVVRTARNFLLSLRESS